MKRLFLLLISGTLIFFHAGLFGQDKNKLSITGHCEGCHLKQTNLFDAFLYRANLRGADLSGANLKEASSIATYMSSLSVQTIGNKPIEKDTLIQEILK